MKAADDCRFPAVSKRVIDDGAHRPGGGIGSTRIIAPQALIGRRDQVGAQHAPILPATPHAQPDASVAVPVSVEVAAEFRCPPELLGTEAQDTYPHLHHCGLSRPGGRTAPCSLRAARRPGHDSLCDGPRRVRGPRGRAPVALLVHGYSPFPGPAPPFTAPTA